MTHWIHREVVGVQATTTCLSRRKAFNHEFHYGIDVTCWKPSPNSMHTQMPSCLLTPAAIRRRWLNCANMHVVYSSCFEDKGANHESLRRNFLTTCCLVPRSVHGANTLPSTLEVALLLPWKSNPLRRQPLAHLGPITTWKRYGAKALEDTCSSLKDLPQELSNKPREHSERTFWHALNMVVITDPITRPTAFMKSGFAEKLPRHNPNKLFLSPNGNR